MVLIFCLSPCCRLHLLLRFVRIKSLINCICIQTLPKGNWKDKFRVTLFLACGCGISDRAFSSWSNIDTLSCSCIGLSSDREESRKLAFHTRTMLATFSLSKSATGVSLSDIMSQPMCCMACGHCGAYSNMDAVAPLCLCRLLILRTTGLVGFKSKQRRWRCSFIGFV